jgi:hypothetical protein
MLSIGNRRGVCNRHSCTIWTFKRVTEKNCQTTPYPVRTELNQSMQDHSRININNLPVQDDQKDPQHRPCHFSMWLREWYHMQLYSEQEHEGDLRTFQTTGRNPAAFGTPWHASLRSSARSTTFLSSCSDQSRGETQRARTSEVSTKPQTAPQLNKQ